MEEAQNGRKRPRQVPNCASSSSAPNPNPIPNSLPNVPGFYQNHLDLIISSFLSLPDLSNLSPSLSIESCFDRVLDKLYESSSDDSIHGPFTARTLELASLLEKSTLNSFRKYATLHNSKSWVLPHELTVKVFAMLDTKSMLQASACCTMFEKCAKDPECYYNIDLTTQDVPDSVVSRIISVAGKELRSLRIGRRARPFEIRASMLTGACLAPLHTMRTFKRDLLRSLHIYSSQRLEGKYIEAALSAFPNLTDLKIVGVNGPLDRLACVIPIGCEHLFLEKENDGKAESSFLYFLSLGVRWPNLTSLSLIGFKMNDIGALRLIQGIRTLKYIDLSRADEINGSFFSNMIYYCRNSLLETIILRDCPSVDERSICYFLDLLIGGYASLIRHIDISSNRGLIINDAGRRRYKPKFSLKKLKEARPGLTFVADFTSPYSSSSVPVVSLSSSSSEDIFLAAK